MAVIAGAAPEIVNERQAGCLRREKVAGREGRVRENSERAAASNDIGTVRLLVVSMRVLNWLVGLRLQPPPGSCGR
jgi:hypothetical protein